MKKSFICSIICHNGIIGGGIYVDDASVTYKTNKLTVDRRYKNLVLPLHEICELSWKRMIFPVATIRMKGGEVYRFMIFNKRRFNECYNTVKKL